MVYEEGLMFLMVFWLVGCFYAAWYQMTALLAEVSGLAGGLWALHQVNSGRTVIYFISHFGDSTQIANFLAPTPQRMGFFGNSVLLSTYSHVPSYDFLLLGYHSSLAPTSNPQQRAKLSCN